MAGPWWIVYPAFTVSLLISAPELKRAKVSEPRERIHLRDNRVTSNERGEDGLALFFLLLVLGSRDLLALDPLKALTQYTRTAWTQADGLPQDTIRAITQTQDGYLWLGTDEGLARFDVTSSSSSRRTTVRCPVIPSRRCGPARAEPSGLGRPTG